MEPMKVSISATIDKDLAAWIDTQVSTGKYRNRSHFIEEALKAFREKRA